MSRMISDEERAWCTKNRYSICTQDAPWNGEGRCVHPDATYVGDVDTGGSEVYDRYKCPYCGKVFDVEVAQ